jgi:hypothetical protein
MTMQIIRMGRKKKKKGTYTEGGHNGPSGREYSRR